MNTAAEKLTKKFGANLSESLGVRTPAASAAPAASSGRTVAAASPDDGRTRAREAGFMEIERIVPDPNQPRKEFDAEGLDNLAESLKRHGQLLPVRVRWSEELAKWVLISGERRYQAAKRAGLKTLSCVFVDRPLSDAEVLQEQIIENLLREDLKPIEQARAYKSLMDTQGWNGAQVAEALNVSKATVTRVLALLKLPSDIQDQVEQGGIPASAGYELTKLPTEAARREVAERIVREGLRRQDAVDVVREVADRLEAAPPVRPAPAPATALATATVQPRAVPEAAPVAQPQQIRGNELHGVTPAEGAAPVITPVTTAEASPRASTETALEGPPANAAAETMPEAVPVKKKPGKPRTGTKERAYRVDGARVVVTFAKKVPSPEEVVAALEQALEKAREASGASDRPAVAPPQRSAA